MKVSWSKCPHCNKMLNIDIEGGAGTTQDFGESIIYSCQSCNGKISNEMKEWAEISPFIKIKSILRTLYTVIFVSIGAAFTTAMASKYIFNNDENTLIKYSIIAFILSFIILSYFFIKSLMKRITKSKKRTKT